MAQTPNPDDTTPQPKAARSKAPQSSGPQSPGPQSTAPQSTGPRPTEQLPMESTPVSATDAAAGGATGLPDEPTNRPSIIRRHPLAAGITAGAIAVVLISGLTAWGVGAAVTASLTSSNSAAMPMGTATTPPTTAPVAGGAAKAGRMAFRATIQSMGSNSWTILTKKGKTLSVVIDSATQFGTKKTSSSAGSFAVGDSVVVVVAMDGTDGTPTATRIAELPANSADSGASTSTMGS